MLRKGLLAIVLLIAIYMVGIEPRWMKSTEMAIPLSKLKKQVRVLFLSDLQLRGNSGYREEWILKQLPHRKIDLILTAGDFFDTPEGMDASIAFLERLSNHAPTAAILGNWEHWSRADLNAYKAGLEQRGIPLLVNQHRSLTLAGQEIYILGVDDPSQDFHNLPLALRGVPAEAFKILLAHGPIIFPIAETNRIDLMLAGHTHGGQVRIPFMDPLFLPPGCGPYFYGIYKKNQSTLLVTSGVGTSILPVRFWCRPEIVFLNLTPENQVITSG